MVRELSSKKSSIEGVCAGGVRSQILLESSVCVVVHPAMELGSSRQDRGSGVGQLADIGYTGGTEREPSAQVRRSREEKKHLWVLG
jgi:hypothetical protein